MKHRVLLAVLLAALLGMVQGCGKGAGTGKEKGAGEDSSSKQTDTKTETLGGAEETDPEENPVDADLLLEGAGLVGSVVEFSKEGCSLLPVYEGEADDGGGLAWSAAEGYEADAEKIQVSYGPDCTFQIAKVDSITARATYEPASLEEVKKQTNLVLYGSYAGDGSFLAESVYIYRRTEG